MYTYPISHKGFTYDPNVDDQDDEGRPHYEHKLTDPTGAATLLPYSPQRVMLPETFRAWVDAGCPEPSLFGDLPHLDDDDVEWLAGKVRAGALNPLDHAAIRAALLETV